MVIYRSAINGGVLEILCQSNIIHTVNENKGTGAVKRGRSAKLIRSGTVKKSIRARSG